MTATRHEVPRWDPRHMHAFTELHGQCAVEIDDATWHLMAYDSWEFEGAPGDPDRIQRRIGMGINPLRNGTFSYSMPKHLSAAKPPPPDVTIEHETAFTAYGHYIVLRVFTEEHNPADPEGTISRHVSAIVRSLDGTREAYVGETGAGYVRRKKYVPPPAPPAPEPPTDLDALERRDAMRCPDCDHVCDESDAVRMYECSRCSQVAPADDSGRGRCSECHIFTAKLHDLGCPECEANEEPLEPCVVVDDPATGVTWIVNPDNSLEEAS